MDNVKGEANDRRRYRALIACEESQRVCIAFRERGWEAYSCDIQEPSGGHPEWHIQGDVLSILRGGCQIITLDGETHDIPDRWNLIVAFPPCTYLSNAGSLRLVPNGVLNEERYEKMIQARDFFLQFWNADCEHVAVENPAPTKRAKLPQYTQHIEPWQFGEPWKKRTLLWLRGLPELKWENPVRPLGCWVQASGRTCRTKLLEKKGVRDPKLRSKTFAGIAAAMARQWDEYIRYGDDQIKMEI